ncbi:pyridoxal-phosphate dependent enzyme [Amycolatopsis sp. NPDC059021]|uniref:pyridoxal-phosphate dependent enzyme n=1 Tax=Amycolatopsis sp. NPDC059021 TaxID=3346704 RepID=UPI00366D8C10
MQPPELCDSWAMDPELEIDFRAVCARFPALGEFFSSLGGTSLREVPSPRNGAGILAKCEWENPCGSIKDRTAFALLADALRDVDSAHEVRLLEYSGGNLAEPLSVLAGSLGIDLSLYLPGWTSKDYAANLRSRGCRVELVETSRGFLGVVEQACRHAGRESGLTFLYQHRNPANCYFHKTTTGAEIVSQLSGIRPDLLVASVGTGGTMMGVLMALRQRWPELRGVVVTPQELPYGTLAAPKGERLYAGSGGVGFGMRQPFVREIEEHVAEFRTVARPAALYGMLDFFQRTGTRIGSSAAANWLSAWEVAAALRPDQWVVTLFPDAGSRDEWQEITG